MTRALITGATSGIGRATATALARDGHEVIVHGRDPERGAQVAAETGGTFIAADLADADDVLRLAREAGDVDILVNNAGISIWRPTPEFELGDLDALFASNVRAPFLLVRELAPKMRAGGAIISVSSQAGRIGMTNGAAYGATKAALEAMTRSWASEFGPRGIRVNAIAPGPVYTNTPSGTAFIRSLGDATALHRASQPEEIGEAIAFLASARASYITGATLAADGGRTAI
jgi:NAD(P)-dependent dehydrogenase (short-subunit alcohol dehydrogenase family)